MVIKWSDCVHIREPRRKGHSIFAAPSGGVALMGAAQARLIRPSVLPRFSLLMRRRLRGEGEDTQAEVSGQKRTAPGLITAPAEIFATA